MSKKTSHLTLYIPGLHHFAKLQPPMPLLQRLLSRADKGKAAKGGIERELFSLFNLLIPAKAELPIAALTYELDTGEPAPANLLRADPVHCQASRDQVIMVASSLDLTLDEAQKMTADLNWLFAEDGWEFIAATPQRWYLRLPKRMKVKSRPLSQVLGKDIHKLLPECEGQTTFHRSLSEIEMLLHSNFSNQQRLQHRQLPVSTLWLWGGGELPAKPACDFVQVWSGDALALGLAKYAGIPRSDIPASGADWLQQQVTPGHHLVVIPTLEDPIWFEEQWITPLSDALSSGKLASIELLPGNGHIYQFSRRIQSRWWRRSRPLASLL